MAKNNFINKVNPNVLLIVGGVVVGYFFIVKPLLETLGLKKSSEDEAVEQEGEKNYWSPNFFLQVPKNTNITLLSIATIQNLARKIYDSLGTFNDDEETIIGVFKALTAQIQVSQLAKYYFDAYHKDLFNELKNYLSTEEIGTIIKAVNKLPKYKK